ncbi:hypothetical protein PV327_000795 [Microctonus hyperodae]|uniref:Protein regulator of cytokinesis 1 n=1 Tax=Microctonus hyperodae TaxID=165561 RepID=A0AA39G788_MICHY|nr:hypothetical protein PV327_000795 [Microctonus hyperodae]
MADNITEQETLYQLNDEAKKIIPNIYKIWNDIGYDVNTIKLFSKDIFNNTRALWSEMLQETEERKYNLTKKVEMLRKQISILEKKLNLDVIPTIYENEPLAILEAKLKNHFNNLEQIKEERLTEAKRLLQKEQLLCKSLGMKPVGMNNSLPTEEELENFSLYLTEKEDEFRTLKESFKNIRESVKKMMAEMSYTPKYDFERLICNNHEDFIFSPTNMAELQELHNRIKDDLENMKKTAENKRHELINLWRYLDISEKDYREFLKKHSGFDTSTIAALNDEIAKCKGIRTENIARFVQKLREDLIFWWDTCKFSKIQRDAFRPMRYETFTEDILTLHELELARVQKFYNENSAIYELLNKREEMWDQMKELQHRAEDPDRFHNRGGQLLAEEKMRKYFNKNLPKVEIELQSLMVDYETKHGIPFTINGLTFEEYIKQQVDEHKAEMETLKQARVKARDEKKSAKKTPLSASRRTPGVATSIRAIQTSLKRKQVDRSPLATLNKAPRMANSENSRPKAHGSKIRRSSRVVRRLLGSSMNKGRSPRKLMNATKTVDSTTSTACSSTSKETPVYQEFKEYLGNRDELRSTIVPESDISIVKPKKKPVKTPVKPTRKHLSPRITPITPRVTPSRYMLQILPRVRG